LAVQSLASPATQVVYPRASYLFSVNPREAWHLVKRLASVLLPAIGIASLLMVILAGPIVSLIAGNAYAESISIVRVLAILPVVITAAAILGPVVMMNVNLSKQLMRIYLAIGCLNVLLLPYMVWTRAADGAAISLAIAESFGPIAMLAVLWRHRASLRGNPTR
jgi:O-antigen flippase